MEDILLKQEKEIMTVIFAAKEDNRSLLLGADTFGIDKSGVTQIVHKLRRINNVSVAWGCSGDLDMSKQFNRWLENCQWPPLNLGMSTLNGIGWPGDLA